MGQSINIVGCVVRFINSCVAMSSSSLLLDMRMLTTYPDNVLSYHQYNDANLFQPIIMDCSFPASEVEKDSCKLLSMITYKTYYCNKDGKMSHLT